MDIENMWAHGCGNTKVSLPVRDLNVAPELFNYPVEFTFITSAVITPNGVTYDLHSIKKALEYRSEEPTSRLPLKDKDLLPNCLYGSILALFADRNSNLDMDKLRSLLSCPLADEVFNDPVVAADGQTYERAYIQAWLDEHDNIPPLAGKADSRLYPNLLIRNLLDNPALARLVHAHRSPLEMQNEALIKPLREYQQTRVKEGNFHWFFFSWRRLDKVMIAADLKRVLRGKMSAQMFFARHEHDINAVKTGRLGRAAKPALNNVLQMQNKTI